MHERADDAEEVGEPAVGTGGVGESLAAIARRRDPGADLFQTIVLADHDLALMADYEFPGGLMEMDSEYKRTHEAEALTAPLA